MTGKETLSIGLITSGGDETEQYVNLLQQHQVAVNIRLQPSEIAAEHIANNSLHVWLLDIDDNDWTDQLDDLLDQSQVPVFFHERGSLSSQSHPEFWIQKQLERLYDMAGIALPTEAPDIDQSESVELTDAPTSDETEDSVARLEQVTEELSSALKNLATEGSDSANVIDEVVDEVEQVAQELESDSIDWNEADFDLDSQLEEPESDNDDGLFSKQYDEPVDERDDALDESLETFVEPSEIEFESPELKTDEHQGSAESSEFNLELEPTTAEQSENEPHEESLTADHLDSDLDDFAADLDAFLEQKDSAPEVPSEHDEPLMQESEQRQSEITATETDEQAQNQSESIYDKPVGFDDELEDWTLDNISLEEDSSEAEHDEPSLAADSLAAAEGERLLDTADDAKETSASELSLEQEEPTPSTAPMEWSLEPLEDPSTNNDPSDKKELLAQDESSAQEESSAEHESFDEQDSLNESEQQESYDLSEASADNLSATDSSTDAATSSDSDEDIGSWDLELDDEDVNLELDLSMPESDSSEPHETEPVLNDNYPEESVIDELQSSDDGLDFSLDDDTGSSELQSGDEADAINRDEADLSFDFSDDSLSEDNSQLEFTVGNEAAESAADELTTDDLLADADDSDELESIDIPLLDDAAVGMQFDELDETEEEIELPELNLWVLGASLGGPAAVKRFLQALPRDLDTAFVLAQHIDDNFLPVLCEILDTQTPFKSIIIDQPMPLKAGCVYIAPIKHKIAFTNNGMVDVVDEPWTPPYSPCIDDVIVSAGEVYRSQCGVIIFSGMGNDGTQGLEQVHSYGVKAWAQSPDSCANSSMPESAIDKQLVEFIGHPEQLARQLKEQLESAVSV